MEKKETRGRKTNYYRARYGELSQMSIDWLIDNFDSFDKLTKIRVSLEIAKKCIPLQANIQTSVDFKSLAVLAHDSKTITIPVANEADDAYGSNRN